MDPVRRKRLLHRARYRGFKEADLLIGRFAEAALPAMSDAELDEFEVLLAAPDPDLYAWIAEGACAPAEYRTPLLERLRAFHGAAPVPRTASKPR